MSIYEPYVTAEPWNKYLQTEDGQRFLQSHRGVLF